MQEVLPTYSGENGKERQKAAAPVPENQSGNTVMARRTMCPAP